MTRVLKVDDDNYRIQVQPDGNITLDLHYGGTVYILGNLDVKGVSTNVESTNINISNNIFTLNNGQIGPGISAILNYQSGIEVDRGDYSNAQLFFKETIPHTHLATTAYTATATTATGYWITLNSVAAISAGSTIVFTGTVFGSVVNGATYYVKSIDSVNSKIQVSTILGGSVFHVSNGSGSMTATVNYIEVYGSWVFKTADEVLSGLELETITSGGSDLLLDMQDSASVVRITNSSSYAANIVDPNTLVTKQWTEQYVAAGSYATGIADVSTIYYINGTIKSRVTTNNTSTTFYISETQRATITSAGLDVDNVNIFGNTVKNSTSNNLILTSTSGDVEVNSVLRLDDNAGGAGISGTTKIWSASNTGTYTGTGKTGIFFANLITSDELISKNRALLFSVLF
jgi:hypothetical protein